MITLEYIFSTTLYYYTEYWILYFKVIIECNFNIKCNLNGNLTNYESRSLEIDLIGFENIY